jgi:SMC interacting uncharacterized protein involved in chromosome segregation
MISDTPRTDAWKRINDPIEDLHAFARQLERELNAVNSKIELLMSANADVARIADERDAAEKRVRLLIAERDTARLQADRHYKLREEFTDLLGTDDVEQGVAVVGGLKERISKLNDYVAALETAGELMANELSYGYDVDMWTKAKEAKP